MTAFHPQYACNGFRVVERHEIDGERAYPIYLIRSTFSECIPEDEMTDLFYRNRKVTGRPTRFAEHAEKNMMYESVLTPEQLTSEIQKTHVTLLKTSPTAEDVVIEITLRIWETWCAGWFNHWTWPKHRSDIELKQSFRQYVNRHSRYQGILPDALRAGYSQKVNNGEYLVCLMGAEQSLRWHGENESSESVVCRCTKCGADGVVRINH